jgi:heat shock protein HtpX
MPSDRSHRLHVLAALGAVLAIDLLFVCLLALLIDPFVATGVAVLARALGVAEPTAPVRWAVAVGVVLVAFVALQLTYVRRATLAEASAEPVTAEASPDLVARVERLSQVAGVRTPTVAVAPSEVPNSFTVGGVANATLVVSEGLLAALDDEELDAVLAHELAHVANRDVRVMTLASLLPALADGDLWPSRTPRTTAAALVGILALYLLSVPHLGGSPLAFLAALAVVALVGAVALGALAAPVLVLARRLSRYREFAADRGGATICGGPAPLVAALRSLDDAAATPTTDKRRAYEGGVERLCFLPHGLAETEGDENESVEIRSHPSVAERIDRLRDLD